mmetsp:Transcript_128972/g.223786  ORF Transcript_128972/g.223786 Transcript_128972/m.223786 type:complete len:353 (-) Transcript_128972:12-1070(-)
MARDPADSRVGPGEKDGADVSQQNNGPASEIAQCPPMLDTEVPAILAPKFDKVEAAEPESTQAAQVSRPTELGSLEACLHDLAEAEARWGADHACVAQSLRRMAYLLECQGKRHKALPLWMRILEIEQRYLGSEHPDVIAARAWISAELEGPALRKDAAIAYAEQLSHGNHTAEQAGTVDKDQQRSSMRDTAVSAAATAGGVAVGSALNLGIAAASSTTSFVMDTTGHVAHFALRKSVSSMLPVEHAELVSGVVSSGCSAAIAPTRRVSNAAVEAMQSVGVSAAATATTSALSFAGHKAWDSTAWAASGARRVLRRLSNPAPSSSEPTEDDDTVTERTFGRPRACTAPCMAD